MRNQTKRHLDELKQTLQQLDLWQAMPPAEEAFLSQSPFYLDTMEPQEWLQWVFIPRMQALLDSHSPLPSQIAISPYIEEALKEFDALEQLLKSLVALEELLQNQ
ncbi:YqcC family protein [Rodentibacter trehalosifermentans]|uniref:Anhydro-N-acetylmuramic acid kinase n=1 Tax=Rodentibacter trehalosifermentans TaxID=1908263 RepID=A0A1V3J7S8_9PAST|nr:YqcC family protein [Rodentibacter trehalosifermentans]OOF46048.1 anhydro-N-acetylmuramic acid kinase [Rodentibacter trehalosifermentans]OOF49829.1 anhydro-N-acetylmuramic acid kinase [Rodentibacter trehalosifermentans]OOF51405.1 anhydro-N-acetylmuramic acid kinase [Rodentibacter trehalosifermentans]